MNNPIILFGGDAHSQFRIDALRAAMSKANPIFANAGIAAKWVYAIDIVGVEPDSPEQRYSLTPMAEALQPRHPAPLSS